MALNIKNPQVEELAREVARLTGETKTEAIRRALWERRQRLSLAAPALDRVELATGFLEGEIWANIPRDELGKPLSQQEWDAILGYGEDGV